MSTILKALKRAEQDSPGPDRENTPSMKVNARTTLNSRIQHRQAGFPIRSKWLVVVLGSAIAATAAAYVLFSGNKAVQFEPPTQKKAAQSSVAAPAPAAAPAELKSRKPSVLPVAGSKKEATEISPAQITARKTPPAAFQEHTDPDIPKKAVAEEPPVIPEILPLEEGILKIQAIAWSEDPADRIAVINNEILGEKESVQGYLLLHIEKDEVILRHSGREYKLVFKIR